MSKPDDNEPENQDPEKGEGEDSGESHKLPAEVDPEDEEVERLAEMLPPNDRKQFLQILHASMSHRGPLPTPGFLRQYEEILPGLAERIVRLPEREQEHRHGFANEWLRREARLKDRGQVMAMVAIVIILGFCLGLAYMGDTKTAGAVAIALVVGVVGIFVTGKLADAKAAAKDDSDAA